MVRKLELQNVSKNSIALEPSPKAEDDLIRFSSNEQGSEQEPSAIEECLLRSFEPLLCCIICAEVFHKAVNVIPCGHNFCLICLLRSMCSTKTTICPQCREPMHDIGLAYTINSIVDVFLELYPDRRRPSDELEVLDVMLRDVVKEARNRTVCLHVNVRMRKLVNNII